MTPDQIGELLTAFLDGELDSRQRRAVERLLQQSSEARQILTQLREGAGFVRGLPRHRPRHDLTEPVLRSIAERRVHPCRAALAGRPVGLPAWFGVGIAAAVLLLAVTASYFYFVVASKPPTGKQEASSHPQKPAPEASRGQPGKLPVARLPRPAPKATRKDEPHTVVQNPRGNPPSKRPATATHRESALAGPTDPPAHVEVFAPSGAASRFTIPLHSLDGHAAQQRLNARLSEFPAYRLDLVCLHRASGFGRLQKALESHKVVLLIESPALAAIKTKPRKVDLAIYSESLTAAELAAILQGLGSADARAAQRRPNEAAFGSLMVNKLSEDDQVNLAVLLGVEPGTLRPATRSDPLGVDLRRPLTESTADDLTAALAGKGRPRPKAGQTATKKPQAARMALILALSTKTATAEQSAQTRRFLDARKQRRPGALPFLLILHSADR